MTRRVWWGTTALGLTLLVVARNVWQEAPLDATASFIVVLFSAVIVALSSKAYDRYGATAGKLASRGARACIRATRRALKRAFASRRKPSSSGTGDSHVSR
jgi:hypothetical protein